MPRFFDMATLEGVVLRFASPRRLAFHPAQFICLVTNTTATTASRHGEKGIFSFHFACFLPSDSVELLAKIG
jgi:hypothetical protein